MPLPSPSGESKNEFISRCMSQLKGEFPDKDQRLAVCFKQWRGTSDSYTTKPNSFVNVTGEGIFSGYASLFSVPDLELDMIAPGAFAKSIETGPTGIRMLFEHNVQEPIGRWLEMREDQYGLFVRGQLDLNVARAREIKSLMEGGNCDGLSIMGEIKSREKGVINEIDLWEISVCSFPVQRSAGLDSSAILRAYGSVQRLPAAVRRVLPAGAQEVYRRAFNRFVRMHPEGAYSRAHAVAWRAVRRKYRPPHKEVGAWSLRIHGDGKMHFNDTVTLDGSRRTEDGFLTGNVRVARTGIQIYRGYEVGKPDMQEVRVYRPESEVFKRDALHSFAHRPVTIDHPSEMVNASNWKKYAVGQTGDDVLRDGNFVRVPMVLMDAAAIKAVEDGKKQLSMGYTCDLKWGDGVTPEGEKYDAMQVEIRGNHLAVVGAARGGDQLRIDGESELDVNDGSFAYANKLIADGKFDRENELGDGAALSLDTTDKFPFVKDGIVYRSALRAIRQQASQVGADSIFEAAGKLIEQIDSNSTATTEGNNMPDVKLQKVEIDGLEVEVTDATASVLRKGIANLVAKAAALQKAFEEKEEGEKKKKEETDAKDAAVAAEIADLKKKLADAASPATLDKHVSDRAALVASAKVLHDKVTIDGKTNAEIRREVVSAKLGEKAKDWADEAISTAFETMASFADTKGDKKGDALAAALRDREPKGDEREKAYDERNAKLENAWKETPKSA